MLCCGNPKPIGYTEYRCLDCGQGSHVVPMSCKSALCLRCAKVYVDNFVSKVSDQLHEGVIYRHTILTVPAMLRQTLPTPGVKRLVDLGFRREPKGFIAQVQKGDVPARYHTLATYLAKYVVTLPISVRRVDRYDSRRVTYHYRSHRTERTEHETVDVLTLIGRMVQHVVPKGFQRVRYYGVQATKTFAKLKPQ